MPRQLVGYYNSLKASLLDDFDRASERMNPSLVVRYGEELADALRRDARSEYELLIPDIPFITGLRARLLNIFLLITAQEVAVYKAMKKRDMLSGDVTTLQREALRKNRKDAAGDLSNMPIHMADLGSDTEILHYLRTHDGEAYQPALRYRSPVSG